MTGLMLRRAVLVLLAVLLAWQTIKVQMASHFAQEAAHGVEGAANTALWWDASQPAALESKARHIAQEGGDSPTPATLKQAADLLGQAIAQDPSRATAVAGLALVEHELGDVRGTALASLADRLAPVEPRVQRSLARYAIKNEDLPRAVMHIARAMVGAPESASQYYPMLLQVAADPEARAVLEVIATNPAPFPWWNSFFGYVAANAKNLDGLRSLVALRESSAVLPLTEWERNRYISRLRTEGLVAEAYLHWVNGLNSEQLLKLGYLYDGGFEEEFANDSGFGWVASPPRNSGIRINRGDTYGVSGDHALRLSFRGKRVRFSQLYQYVFLSSGSYIVSGRARPDKLVARRGLQWRLYCSSGMSGTLGESELLVGTGDWRNFEFAVEVPPDCSGQVLRLYSAGSREVDHELNGGIWFDDLQIRLNK